jgi:lipoprotein signal peptidase
MTFPSNRWLFWGLAGAGAILDQVTKYGVFYWLYTVVPPREKHFEVIPGVFEFLAQFTGNQETGKGLLAGLRTWGREDFLPKVNHGALFGLFSDHVFLANGVFAVISILAALAITYWARRPSAVGDRCLSASLGLILAGTLGNLFDRVVFGGVRDFMHLHYYTAFDWPVFNLADCCLVCGAVLLLGQAFLGQSSTVEEVHETSKLKPRTEKMAEVR